MNNLLRWITLINLTTNMFRNTPEESRSYLRHIWGKFSFRMTLFFKFTSFRSSLRCIIDKANYMNERGIKMKLVSQILILIEYLPSIVIDHWIIFALIGFIILNRYKTKIKRFSRKVMKFMYIAQGSIISLGILRDILRLLVK